MKSNELNGAALAYLGDAVIELMAREAALTKGLTGVGRLNAEVSRYVRATAQSAAVAKIEDLLTEEEAAVYRRGRNSSNLSVPKSASAAEYRRATGLEALFAHLYLEGQRDRMTELFRLAYAESDDENPPLAESDSVLPDGCP